MPWLAAEQHQAVLPRWRGQQGERHLGLILQESAQVLGARPAPQPLPLEALGGAWAGPVGCLQPQRLEDWGPLAAGQSQALLLLRGMWSG